MAVISSDSMAGRSVLGLVHRVGEFVYVCAIYLGIAVLVTVLIGFTVPSMREQARQAHEALLSVFRPTYGINQVWFASYGADVYDMERYLQDEDQAGDLPAEDAQAAHQAESSTRSPDMPQLSFSRALQASVKGRYAEGLTEAQAEALRSYLARKFKIAHSVAGALVNTVFVVAKERGLDPQLVLAVIAIESRYNPYAESHVGAQGLMQVLTRVHKDKFEVFSDGPIAALNPIANIRVGTQILYDCIQRRGSVEKGLACYVGATGPNDGGYGAKVLAERRRIALASGIPVEQ